MYWVHSRLRWSILYRRLGWDNHEWATRPRLSVTSSQDGGNCVLGPGGDLVQDSPLFIPKSILPSQKLFLQSNDRIAQRVVTFGYIASEL